MTVATSGQARQILRDGRLESFPITSFPDSRGRPPLRRKISQIANNEGKAPDFSQPAVATDEAGGRFKSGIRRPPAACDTSHGLLESENMNQLGKKWGLCAAALLLSASGASAATINQFTGGDPGEGLDFEGTFLYATHVGGPAGPLQIGDATFIDADVAPGIDVIGPNNTPFGTPSYGDSPNDNNLEQ